MWISRTLDIQRELFFKNSKLLGLGRQIWLINTGAFGLFSAKISVPILVQWVPCPSFNHYFYTKLSLYSHIPNVYLESGFEFGPSCVRSPCMNVCRYLVLWNSNSQMDSLWIYMLPYIVYTHVWKEVIGRCSRHTLTDTNQSE